MTNRFLGTLLLAAALGAGCAPDRASIEYYGVCGFPDTCTFSGECDAHLLTLPWIDMSLSEELWLPIEMRNQIPDNTDSTELRVNTNDFYVTSYSITYSGATSPVLIPSATKSVNAVVPAGGRTVVDLWPIPGGTTASTAISTYAALGLGAMMPLVATVTASGVFANGREYETEPFDVAFEVCDGCAAGWAVLGCVQTCPPSATLSQVGAYDCP